MNTTIHYITLNKMLIVEELNSWRKKVPVESNYSILQCSRLAIYKCNQGYFKKQKSSADYFSTQYVKTHLAVTSSLNGQGQSLLVDCV